MGKSSPESLTQKNSEEDALRSAIKCLPADRQLMLVLKYGEDKSNQDIGKVLKRSEGAIKSLFHRTLGELRLEMEKRGFGREYFTGE